MINKPAGAFSDPNLIKRIISALILAPLFIYAVYVGGTLFNVIFALIGLIIMWEWNRMIKGEWTFQRFLEAVPYAIIASIAPILLRLEPNGAIILLWVCLIVWGTDVGAYFAGRSIGGPKLAAKFSPNKTWSGAVGGVIVGTALALYCLHYFKIRVGTGAILFTLALSIISQIGDLYESALKRRLGVKDSSNLIPGHGGVMDRLDGFIFAAAFALFARGFF